MPGLRQPIQPGPEQRRPNAFPGVPGIQSQLPALQQQEEHHHYAGGAEHCRQIKQNHYDNRGRRAHKTHGFGDPERGPEIRAGPALDEAAQVEEAIHGEKHHGYDACNRIQFCDEDPHLPEEECQDECVARLVGLAIASSKPARRDAVLAEGLQDTGRSQDTSQRRGQGGAPDTGHDRGGKPRDLSQDIGLLEQQLAVDLESHVER